MQSTMLSKVLTYFYQSFDTARSNAGRVSKTSQQRYFFDLLERTGKQSSGNVVTGSLLEMLRLSLVTSWVYADVNLIANRLAATPKLFTIQEIDDPDDNEVEDDEGLYTVLKNPNPLMTGNFLMRYTSTWMSLIGNAFWYVVTSEEAGGEILEIWPIPSDKLMPMPETLRPSLIDGKPIIDYYYAESGSKLAGEYVVHFRTANPTNYWVGLAPLSALQLPILTDHGMQSWLDTFFGEENGIPAAIISVPATLSPDQFADVRESLREQFSGGRKTAITRSGDLDVEVIQHAISEMKVVEGRSFNRDEIDSVLGVPEGLVSGGLSGDSRLAAEITFARNVIQPMTNLIVAEIELSLLPLMGKADEWELIPENLVPQDRALEVAEYNSHSPVRTLNQNRAAIGERELTLSGDFAELQPLVDQIPQFLVPMIAPTVIEKWKYEYTRDIREDTTALTTAETAINQQFTVTDEPGVPSQSPQLGDQLGDEEGTTPGYHDSGQVDPEQQTETMVGKSFWLQNAALTSAELDTAKIVAGFYVNGNGRNGN